MKLIYLVPFFIGILGILQGALIKNISLEIGVAHGTLIGMTITFILGIILFLFIKQNPQVLPAFYSVKQPLSYFKWWYLIPSFFGFFILFFFPQAMHDLGAVKVTILIIAGQIITSTLWDLFVDKISMTGFKLLGLFFALLSLIFSVL